MENWHTPSLRIIHHLSQYPSLPPHNPISYFCRPLPPLWLDDIIFERSLISWPDLTDKLIFWSDDFYFLWFFCNFLTMFLRFLNDFLQFFTIVLRFFNDFLTIFDNFLTIFDDFWRFLNTVLTIFWRIIMVKSYRHVVILTIIL